MSTHKVPESERFKGSAKYVEYLCARMLVAMLQRLPIRCAYSLGRCVGWLAWKTMKRRRDTVRKNLEIVNAWMDERAGGGDLRREVAEHQTSNVEHRTSQLEKKLQAPGLKFHPSAAVSDLNSQSASLGDLEAQVKEVFQRGGANLFSGFTFSQMSPEQAGRHLKVEGLEHLQSVLSEGKGAVILIAHMGPWEALTQLPGFATRNGVKAPFGSIYRPFNNAYSDRWFKEQREKLGTQLFSSRYKFYGPADFLRKGGILGILSDQRASGGEVVTFFGKKTSATPLPGLLHLRTQAPMLALSVKTIAPTSWCLRLRPIDPGKIDPQARRQALAAVISRAMEVNFSDSVLDGFWFHNRFKDEKKHMAKPILD
jgi:KDO2-lipid IV(A) lauroyltransferase